MLVHPNSAGATGHVPEMEIKRTVLVLHPAPEMYRLVHDVEAYPQFLSWCVGAQVLEQTHELQLARLDVSIGGVRQSFTTRNRLVPHELLTLGLVEGPFRHLAGEWQFAALGEMGSKVTLGLHFDFSNSVLSSAFRRGFASVADKLVYDFSRRADQVYGS
jgi:ribosome-associated toxin RatA of RatAB toxin-antitoxin module